jgi:GNAT superfamily N-acetyltransferase
MPLQVVQAEPHHVSELGRICFEAFEDLPDRHGFPPDTPSVAAARQAIDMLVPREDFYGVAALADGEPVGSNFLMLMNQVAAVGPITVDLAYQAQGVGLALMRDVIDYARHHGIERVRLVQDGFNMASLSLYASLGFEVKEYACVGVA